MSDRFPMPMTARDLRIQQLSDETGMGFVQAWYHLRAQDELRRQDRCRRERLR